MIGGQSGVVFLRRHLDPVGSLEVFFLYLHRIGTGKMGGWKESLELI